MIDTAAKAMAAIEGSLRREVDYLEEGSKILRIYEIKKETDVPFNILYSNTEVLLSSVFTSVPIPETKPRFPGPSDPVVETAVEMVNRLLSYELDSNEEDTESFECSIKNCVLDALLPGRGINFIEHEQDDPVDYIVVRHCAWDRFAYGYARKWSDVPWVAFGVDMHYDQVKKTYPELFAETGEDWTPPGYSSDSDTPSDTDETDPKRKAGPVVTVWRLWDKADKKVKIVCDEFQSKFLAVLDDPLGLPQFFPCPEPLRFVERPNNLIPKSLYSFYKTQAEELNVITKRIDKCVRAMRVRGVYDPSVGDLQKIFKDAGDNDLLAATNAGALRAIGGFDKAIWLVPLETLSNTLNNLYTSREQTKSVIFEINGIADVMRGQGAASETLGGQELKSKWGSLRLQRYQTLVQNYVRSLMRIMTIASFNKINPEAIMQITGIKLPPQMAIEAAQAQYQQQVAMAQQANQPPPPPLPPPPPTMEAVFGLLKNQTTRTFIIDIETNSTVSSQATKDREDITEFMNALNQASSGLGGSIQAGVITPDGARAITLAIVRKFRLGREVQKAVETPPKQTPQEIQLQQQVQQLQQELQMTQAKAQPQIEAQKAELGNREQQLSAREAALQQAETNLATSTENATLKLQLERKGVSLDIQKAMNDMESRLSKQLRAIQGEKMKLDVSQQKATLNAQPPKG